MDEAASCPVDVSMLHLDTACLKIKNNLEFPVNLFSVSSECYQCDPSYWTTVPLQVNVSVAVSAVHSLTLSAARQNDEEVLCKRTISFTQHGVYTWNIKDCIITVDEQGDDPYIPLYLFGALVSLVLLFIAVARCLYPLKDKCLNQLFNRNPVNIDLQNDLGNPSSSSDSLLVQSELVPLRRLSSPRIQALDTFRGITIALMIFVNYGGGKYWFFAHSAWNGLTVADLVFPWFAWVMGVSLVLSYRSKLRSCVTRLSVLSVSLHRTLTLVTLGLLVNMYNKNDLTTVRFCGVLQRLGIAHLIVSTLEIAFMKKQPSIQRGRWLQVSEVVDCWRQWVVVVMLASLQVAVSLRWPLADCPLGYLGPGGRANHSAFVNCTGGVARHIDSLVFGDSHLYAGGHARQVYHTLVPFDPEGILGTLATCLTVYLGVQAGYIILTYNTTQERTVRWLFWAILTGVAAGFLCDWSKEGGLIPVNKQLWSLSFALLTSSTAFLVFTVLFIFIDHFHLWFGDVFRYAGMNAILLYVGHIVTRNTFPWSWKPIDLTSHYELFFMNVTAVCLWLFIARVLHNNNVFLTV